MKLVETEPNDPVLKKYIESYQYFEVTGPMLVKAIPTGTLECWVKLGGSYEIFDAENSAFKPSGSSGIFPMGSQVCAYFIPKEVKCLNIKLRPSILGLSNFKNLVTNWESFSIDQFIGDQGAEKIVSLDFSHFDQQSDTIDAIIKAHNDFEDIDDRIEPILMSMIKSESKNSKISDLAAENHLTVKSLERLVKKTFGMTPKKLMGILRFGNSIKYLNKTEGYRFIDALQFGYYDQSHFIRECKKMTDMNPKEFLSKLSLSTNDLVFEEFE